MKSWRKRGGRREPLVAAVAMTLGAAMPAAAQVSNDAAIPAALPVPRAPVIVIPTATPTPAAPRPRVAAIPSPRATPRPQATPRPTATPPRAAVSLAPEPSASATPVAGTTPAAAPPVPPVPAPSSTPARGPITGSATGQGASSSDYWPIVAGVAAVALFALGWVLLPRRATRGQVPEEDHAEAVDRPADAAAPARARLAIAFRPIRAGFNLLSATSENEITVTNIGDAPATAVRLLVRLLSAHNGQDAELDEFYAAAVGRPAVPAFALQPGEQRVLTTIAALPRDAVRTLTVAGRPMFVPLVAVNIVYDAGGSEGQFAQAFPVGVERVDSSKLAPFWLDVPPRTYDQVAARPHAPALER